MSQFNILGGVRGVIQWILLWAGGEGWYYQDEVSGTAGRDGMEQERLVLQGVDAELLMLTIEETKKFQAHPILFTRDPLPQQQPGDYTCRVS